MKLHIVSILLVLLFLPVYSFAQSNDSASLQSPVEFEQPLTFSYQPTKAEVVPFNTKNLLQPTSSTALKSAGFLLQGLKYRSAVDEFNAKAPFDIRKIESLNVDTYTTSITNTQLFRTQPYRVIF